MPYNISNVVTYPQAKQQCVGQPFTSPYKDQIGNPCSYMAPCKQPCGSAYYLHDLETIPFGNRSIHPTSGQAVPELVQESYTSLQLRDGAYRFFPDFQKTRFREEDLEFNPTWRFNNLDYLPWEFQRPHGGQMPYSDRLVDSRQIHRDLSVIKGREPFLFKRFA